MRRWDVLANWINKEGWTYGAEIGVFKGETLHKLMLLCPDLLLMRAIDLWDSGAISTDRDAPGFRDYASHDLDAYYRRVMALATSPEFKGRISVHRMPSAAAAALVPDQSLDFVFIDGDHTYEGVRADITAWLPKVRPGGALTGHDAGSEKFPGVTRALDEMLSSWTLHDDHVWRFNVPTNLNIRPGFDGTKRTICQVLREAYRASDGQPIAQGLIVEAHRMAKMMDSALRSRNADWDRDLWEKI